ncbi:MAG: GNAT family N-acetyltransferase [Betaproteobacteria bacterium]|nr:GNAT family N-acetyltransferase [Betaproteobacteria bacterium]
MANALKLVPASKERLPAYVEALRKSWSPNSAREAETAREDLAEIERDPVLFIERQCDREAKGPPIALPDGSKVPRLPGYLLWMWDGEFCGAISLRWQPGTLALPAYVLGHIGYSVVPWKRGRGYAKAALRQMLVHARDEGLSHVEITTDLDNHASRRVIEANGGVLVERFTKPAQYGNREGLRFRVATPIG